MATETLRPNANGDTIQWSKTYGQDNYQCVDEETPDEDTTRVFVLYNVAKTDLYQLADSSGSGTIDFVKVYMRARYVDVSGTCYVKIKTGGTEYNGSNITLTTSYANYSHQWDINPKTGVAWTWADINALQAGIFFQGTSSTLSECRCTQVFVEVDYTPPETPKSSSDAGTGIDAYVSLEKPEAKTSSDAGSGAEGMSLPSAFLAGSENGSGIEALIARLLATIDTGISIEVGSLLKDLFATELGRGFDSLAAKIEMPTKGGGMKLWT